MGANKRAISNYDVLSVRDGANIVVNGGQKFTSGCVNSSYGMVSVTPVNCCYDAGSKTLSFISLSLPFPASSVSRTLFSSWLLLSLSLSA